ncbi:MAG TPA: sigma-54 dependent transcriptional regulator [Myxococcaceae bacterium]|nr:sigma-54 dependent transcriptional regulator [Myxococcaceae bacterium]
MTRVLVVDDEANLRKVLSTLLRRDGYDVTVAEDGADGLAAFQTAGADVVVTDLVMPRMGGMELLKAVHAKDPGIPIVVITAHGTVDSAVEAIKAGAFDFITKPFDQTELSHVIAKAAATRGLNQKSPSADERGRTVLIGESPGIREIQNVIARVAATPSTVLITGESGTGKEVVARRLLEESPRHDKPFIRINCAAIPKDLMESELFGYERGAFTGAVSSKPGRFELADGGTLFLDEIGEIPPEMQVKLLRAVQENEFERVGGIKTLRVDVRLIAATNRDLLAEVEAGRFRQDLYYRLAVVPLHVPPLRERTQDLPALAAHFLRRYDERLGKRHERIDDEALAALQAYSWPGNIRELENLIERLVLFADGPVITLSDLPPPFRAEPPARLSESPVPEPSAAEGGLKDIVRMRSAELERDLIQKALEETGGNVTHAARLLRISRKSLQVKMKEFGLRAPLDPRGDDPPA